MGFGMLFVYVYGYHTLGLRGGFSVQGSGFSASWRELGCMG